MFDGLVFYAYKRVIQKKTSRKFDLDCDAFIIFSVIKYEKYEEKKIFFIVLWRFYGICVMTPCYTSAVYAIYYFN